MVRETCRPESQKEKESLIMVEKNHRVSLKGLNSYLFNIDSFYLKLTLFV